MTLAQRIRWLCAYTRYKGDYYLVHHHGAARIAIAALAIALMVGGMVGMGGPEPAKVIDGVQVNKAVINIFVYIAIMIVAAIIAYALAPKPPTPEPGKSTVPEATDGKAIIRAYGDVWVEDAMVLGFKTMGADPIKAKGGKK